METIGNKKFGIFIQALHNETGDKQEVFIYELFRIFGIPKNDIETKYKNWMAGRNDGYKKYFKGIEINQSHYDNFIKFLDEKINVRFTNIQSILKEYNAEYNYIDFGTDKQKAFFNSILNQFKVIVGLSPEKKKAVPSTRMIEVFRSAILIYEVQIFVADTLPIYFVREDLLEKASTFADTVYIELKRSYLHHQKEDWYQSIYSFICFLNDYTGYLGDNMKSSSRNDKIYIPKCDKGTEEWEEFAGMILYYRRQLDFWYGKICNGESLF